MAKKITIYMKDNIGALSQQITGDKLGYAVIPKNNDLEIVDLNLPNNAQTLLYIQSPYWSHFTMER